MAPFISTKPETVLKQADGLISVGQHEAALQSLTEMFAAKKFRNTPLASLEPIVLRFISLCVDLRQGRTAKEGLMQYKNIAQNSSVASIENVIKKFIALCDAKVEQAQEQANKIIGLGDVDDLEASETPESILLGAVSGDQNKDRTDRALVTPWLKFLWEAYRTALETLKNNNRLEAIYQQIVHQAFKFCLKHNRKVEFRRLCETLRLHLANVAKYSHQTHSINLSDPETLQSHLDARFAQLNTSVELELWQEAFRSVEDVHNLLTMAKKAPRPAMMANYYEKLARIFLMSGSALFHAAAWGRYYVTIRAAGSKSEEELAKLAGLVLVSALAVPIGAEGEDGQDETKGRNARLTALIGLSKMPTRAGLLKEALSRNTLKLAPEPIRQLYKNLEVTFHPLTICATVAPVLQALAADPTYSPYLPLLHKVLLSRLLNQLSQVYSSVKISHVLDLVAPLNAGPSSAVEEVHYDHPHIEAFVMGCAQRGELHVRVDHAQGSITFGTDAFSSSTPSASSPSSLIRNRLTRLATVLSQSLSYVESTTVAPSEEEQQEAFSSLVETANAERARLSLNRTLASRRSELLAELSARRLKEEQSRKAETLKRQQEEDDRRQQELLRTRERQRIEQELEAMKVQEAKKLAETLIEKGTLKVDVKALDDLDSDKLLAMQVEQLDKEKRDLTERLRIVARRLDHTERAFRREERPLLDQDYTRQQEADRKAHDALAKATITAARTQHKEDVETKKRLARMLNDYKSARLTIAGKREEDHAAKKEAARIKMEAEMVKRREQVLKQREAEENRLAEEERQRREQEEAEERARAEREAETERRRGEEAAANAEKEAKAQAEKEAREKALKEREEERARIAEEAKRKLQREEEALARRNAARQAPAPANDNVWRPRIASAGAGPSPSPSPRPASPAQPSSRTAYRPPGARGAETPTNPSPPASLPPSRQEPAPPLTPSQRPAGGSWRERMANKEAAAAANPTPNGRDSPQPPAPSKPAEDAGAGRGVWKPRHLRDKT